MLGVLSDESKEELNILNNSEFLITIITIGTLLRLKYVQDQRRMLIDSNLCPENFNSCNYADGVNIQVVSSLIILYALFEFHKQSKHIARQSCESGSFIGSLGLEVILSGIIVAVSIIRLYIVLASENNNANNGKFNSNSQTEIQEDAIDDVE